MFEFLQQVLRGTPIWVWAVLALLVVLGARQLRPRVVKRGTVLIAPIGFLILGLVTSGRHGLGFVVWLVTFIAIASFTLLVWRPIGRARFDAVQDHLHLPASAIPLVIMLSIFLFNYVVHVTLAVKPALGATLPWQIAPSIVMGLLSGVFMGRAVTLYRLKPVATRA